MAARTSELGSSTLMLSIDSSEFNKGLKDAKAKAEQFSQDVWKHVQKGSKRFAQEHAKTFRKVGMAMSASVTLPVAGFAIAAVKASVDFEEAMEEVISVSGATGAQVDALTEKAKDLGTTTEKTAVEAAEGMKFLAMAGFEVNEVMEALPGVMDLAMVSGMDLGRASDITSNIMSGFGETADQTGRIVDVMALTMASSNTNIEQLGEAMAYVAPAARAAGMDIEQTSALIGKLGDAGIQGSRAGTNLMGVLSALYKPSSEARDILDDLGVSIRDSTGEMRPLVDILKDFDEAGATAADVAGIFGRRNSTAALAIMEVADATKEFNQDLNEAAGTTERMKDILVGGVDTEWKKFKSAIERLNIELGESGLKGIAESVLQALSGLIRGIAGLPSEVLTFVSVMAGLAAAVGPVLLAIGTLIPMVSAGGALATGFAFLTGPIGLTAVALGVLVSALVAFWDPIKNFTRGLWLAVKPVGRAIWGFAKLNPAVMLVVGSVKLLIRMLRAFWGVLRDHVIPWVQSLGNAIGGWFKRTAELGRTGGIAEPFDKVGDAAEAAKMDVDDLAAAENAAGESAGEAARRQRLLNELLTETEEDAEGASSAIGGMAKELKQFSLSAMEAWKAWRPQTFLNAEREAEEMRRWVEDEAQARMRAAIEATAAMPLPTGPGTAPDSTTLPSVAPTGTPEDFGAQRAREAFRAAGIATREELAETARVATENYKWISESGQATARAIDEAWIQMTRARKTALEADGLELPKRERKMLAKLEEQHSASGQRKVGIMGRYAATMETIGEDLSRTLIDNMFMGRASFGSFWETGWKTLVGSTRSILADLTGSVFKKVAKGGIGIFKSLIGGRRRGGSEGLKDSVNGLVNSGLGGIGELLSQRNGLARLSGERGGFGSVSRAIGHTQMAMGTFVASSEGGIARLLSRTVGLGALIRVPKGFKAVRKSILNLIPAMWEFVWKAIKWIAGLIGGKNGLFDLKKAFLAVLGAIKLLIKWLAKLPKTIWIWIKKGIDWIIGKPPKVPDIKVDPIEVPIPDKIILPKPEWPDVPCPECPCVDKCAEIPVPPPVTPPVVTPPTPIPDPVPDPKIEKVESTIDFEEMERLKEVVESTIEAVQSLITFGNQVPPILDEWGKKTEEVKTKTDDLKDVITSTITYSDTIDPVSVWEWIKLGMELLKKMLKDLAGVEEKIKCLTSGKCFGGMGVFEDGVPGINVPDQDSSDGGWGDVAGKAGGTVGKAVGGSALGIINAITGIGTMISSFISNFQQRTTNDRLYTIAENQVTTTQYFQRMIDAAEGQFQHVQVALPQSILVNSKTTLDAIHLTLQAINTTGLHHATDRLNLHLTREIQVLMAALDIDFMVLSRDLAAVIHLAGGRIELEIQRVGSAIRSLRPKKEEKEGDYQTGTNFVPSTGTYGLHRGEAVLTPADNMRLSSLESSARRLAASGGGGGRAVHISLVVDVDDSRRVRVADLRRDGGFEDVVIDSVKTGLRTNRRGLRRKIEALRPA